MNLSLIDLGWNEFFAKHFEPFREQGWKPARLIRDNKISYGALLEDGANGFDEFEVILSGKVYHDAETDAELPAVGDWVALEVGGENGDNIIRARLPRQTCFSRKASGFSAEEQVIAANVNAVIVVTDAGPDYSLRRMERYFTLIARSGSKAVVLVNKADLYPDKQNQEAAEAIRALNADAEVHVTSVKKRKGLKVLKDYLKRGQSVAVIGSSGVGKSALVNLLLGDDWQWVDDVNEVTGKGRHTTTARELLVLEKGGILIDNPGIKEVQMWTNETTLARALCRYRRPRPAVQISRLQTRHGRRLCHPHRRGGGKLDAERYEGYLKLEDEIAKLRKQRKKRQMTVERRNKRDHKIKARNRVDREDIERDLKPRA
jgi:ribosome biogenesis GTPase